ncbi:MAG TPA: hypothetical protein VG937_09720 [Polyangiaceae bacterium]|nr:hypothetical protein [Polyangiaceae bacterium]
MAVNSVKRMVLVEGTTYRIERLGPGQFQAVRIVDDARVGTFQSQPGLSVTSSQIEPSLMYEVAWVALRGARTSSVVRQNVRK